MCCDISAQEEVDISRLKLPPTLGKKISRSRSRSRGKRRSSRSRSPRGAGAAGSRRQRSRSRSRSRSRGRRRSRSRSRDRDSKDRHRYACSSSGRACCLLGCANDALTAIMLVLHRSSRDRSSDRGRGGRPHRSSRSRSPAVRSTKDKDEAEIRRLDDQLFPLLCDILNEYHATAHGLRFWKVLLGHWMRTYMSTVFNRYRTIEQCLERYHVTSTTTVIDERYSLAPADALSATLAANDDLWNQALYSRIISATGNPEIAVEVLSIETACAFLRLEPPSGASLPRRGLRLARGLFTDTLSLLKRDTDAFIINSYLPRQDETKLQLALGQICLLYTSPSPRD